ncbi:hypothetical protein EON62_03230 [archaeon]|nr:MAG: hypothetical protein EON62_03230 [archaeon]
MGGAGGMGGMDFGAMGGDDEDEHDHEGHDHEGHDHEGHDHEGHDHEGHDDLPDLAPPKVEQ